EAHVVEFGAAGGVGVLALRPALEDPALALGERQTGVVPDREELIAEVGELGLQALLVPGVGEAEAQRLGGGEEGLLGAAVAALAGAVGEAAEADAETGEDRRGAEALPPGVERLVQEARPPRRVTLGLGLAEAPASQVEAEDLDVGGGAVVAELDRAVGVDDR